MFKEINITRKFRNNDKFVNFLGLSFGNNSSQDFVSFYLALELMDKTLKSYIENNLRAITCPNLNLKLKL